MGDDNQAKQDEMTGEKMTEEKTTEENTEDLIRAAAGEDSAAEEGAEQKKPELAQVKMPTVKRAETEAEEAEVKPKRSRKKKEEKKEEEEEKAAPVEEAKPSGPLIFALRTTANREDQVMDFVTSNVNKKGVNVFAVIRPHGMRGYIFLEAASKLDAEQAVHGIPYARGILPKEINYSEMEHMIEPVKRELTIKKNDIVEIISGPFKRETAKITRIDEQKEEVVVELVEAAVPIPITLKIDAVKVIRRDTEE